jgi:periplasmic divalent cation tolerance protein
MTDKIVVLTTCSSKSDAERLARALVDARLAACVNVVPGARSFYRWKGAIETAEEFLLLIKTSRDLFPALAAEVEKLHPYEVPELLALPVVAGSMNYMNWFQANLRGTQGGAPE